MTIALSQPLSKPNVTDTRKVRLTSRILHIGSAVSKLNPFEYVPKGQFVYIPNQEALAKTLRQRGFLDDYIYCIENREPVDELLKKALGESWETLKTEDGSSIFPIEQRSLNWSPSKITDLRPMIRNGFGHHYIPGSSIKGAIRTAIAYHLLKDADKYRVPESVQLSEIERNLRESIGELRQRKNQKSADNARFMNELFTNFGLTYQGRQVKAEQGPNTDIMRAIHVSDSEPLIEKRIKHEGNRPTFKNLSVVNEVVISSRFPDYKAKYKAPIYAEMVFNVETQFTLSLDHEMLARFRHKRHKRGMILPFESVDDLLKICQDFAQEQWDFEHDYWATIVNNPNARDRNVSKNLDFTYIQDFYQPKICPCTLRLGWGSGMMGTTINSLMPEDLAALIRDVCASPSNKAPGFEAPKSRRTIMNSKGEIRYVPGWVKLEVL
jgi:CRISPR-associated protein Csm5